MRVYTGTYQSSTCNILKPISFWYVVPTPSTRALRLYVAGGWTHRPLIRLGFLFPEVVSCQFATVSNLALE